ncbi:MAG TPA: hypothetical protein VML55_13445 [Planctomycetaceae bacterium]|nr:hypothetical protein [Planctomycetaceae bacterium]
MAQAETVRHAGPEVGGRRGFAATDRKDPWWAGPLATALGLGAFVVYATGRAIAGCFTDVYYYGIGTPYLADSHAHVLSPFYSPLIVLPESLAWISPAFLILWAPGGFRVTCYYYRKAYYRAFFADPAGCAVGEPSSFCGFKRGLAYKGEAGLLRFQNLHRYFLYLALVFLVILTADVVLAARWPAAGGGREFGVSIGTLVLALNVTLLTFYTFSCHSLRHLVGGRLDCFSAAPAGQARYRLWRWASALNANHMLWAWLSLFSVAFADFYVWMVASGRWSDWRLL